MRKQKQCRYKSKYNTTRRGVLDGGIIDFTKLVVGFCENPQSKTPEDLASEVIRSMSGRPIGDIEIVVRVNFLKKLWEDGLSKNVVIPQLVETISTDDFKKNVNVLPFLRLVKTENGYDTEIYKN